MNGQRHFFFSSVLFVLGAIVLIILFAFKANMSQSFYVYPLLFLYSYFIVIFELSRVAGAMFYERVSSRILPTNPAYEPYVSFVIPCKNEEAAIANTIEKCFAADYPKSKLEVIVVNDGSTDRTGEVLHALKRKYRQLVVIDWKVNRGKRHGMAAGFKIAKGDIVVQLDSDSYIDPRTFRQLIIPFSNPSIGAVCAHADPANADQNMLTKMQAAYYFMSFRVLKAAESAFFTVFCCSGCSSAYRKSVVLPIIDIWLNEKFLGKPVTWGDDRALTNWVLRLGHQTIYTDRARAFTIVPTTMKQLLKQQVRWKKGWFVNSLSIAGFILKTRPFVALTYFFPLIFITLVTPFIVTRIMFYNPIVSGSLPLLYFFGILLIAAIITLYYRHVSRENKYWPYVFVWALLNSVVLSFILFYALFRLNDRKWGTR